MLPFFSAQKHVILEIAIFDKWNFGLAGLSQVYIDALLSCNKAFISNEAEVFISVCDFCGFHSIDSELR
jgi:hypothetical protein